MELNEILRRIGAQHWRLILVCVLVGIEAAALIHHESKTYTASTRVVLDTVDPKSRPESAAIADTARGIATSPAEVANALRAVRATGRDANHFAASNVSLDALGSSGVLQLSVKDRDPAIAAGVANALAGQVLRTRLNLSAGQQQQALRALTDQVDAITTQVARNDALMERLAVRIADTVDPTKVALLQARRSDAARVRDSLAQRAAALETERASILSTGAARPKAAVISRASRPAHADSSGSTTALVLGLILGLVVGIGTAAVVETLRPTLVGSEAVAAELGVPLIGALAAPPDSAQSLGGLGSTATLVRLVAERAAVSHVGLLPVGPAVPVDRLAARLNAEQARAVAEKPGKGSAGGSGARTRRTVAIRPIALRAISTPAAGARIGLVLVAPATVKKSELADARRLLTVAAVPVLGLVTYGTGRSGWAVRWARGTDARPEAPSVVTPSASPADARPAEPAAAVPRAQAGGRS